MTDIGDSQIQPFRSSGWDDMGDITCEKQPTILHWFDDEAAHRQDALLDDGPNAQYHHWDRTEGTCVAIPVSVCWPGRSHAQNTHKSILGKMEELASRCRA